VPDGEVVAAAAVPAAKQPDRAIAHAEANAGLHVLVVAARSNTEVAGM